MLINAHIASGGWVPRGQGAPTAITPQDGRTPQIYQPATQSLAPPPPRPAWDLKYNKGSKCNLLYHLSHWGQKLSGSNMKTLGGGTLNQESGGREGNQEKCYSTRTDCQAKKALSSTQTQCRHLLWPAHAQKRHTTGQEFACMLTKQ